jgi:UDP-N-acetylmuramoylalanine--D-glutamate ligase
MNAMHHLRDLTVLVLGLGDSGLAMARWCARQRRGHVRVWDSRDTRRKPAPWPPTCPPPPCSGRWTWRWTACTLVLKSPGLAPHDPAASRLLAAGRALGIAVRGELDCSPAPWPT